MYVLLTPPPLPGVIIGLVKCPGTVCARLHLKFPRVEGGDPQNGLVMSKIVISNIIPLWNATNKYKDLVAQDMYNILHYGRRKR